MWILPGLVEDFSGSKIFILLFCLNAQFPDVRIIIGLVRLLNDPKYFRPQVHRFFSLKMPVTVIRRSGGTYRSVHNGTDGFTTDYTIL
jgi:hypothetical protein